MIGIEKSKIKINGTDDPNYAEFIVEPLAYGFGNTLGNSMRRVLLSSLPGAAPSRLRIAGVMHEFSTIPGIKEDVTEIVLNVKSLILRIDDSESKVLNLNVKGPMCVTAGMIETSSEVKILNPGLLIATLEDGAELNMEITVMKGVGYVPAEQQMEDSGEIGAILLDSAFSPVLKVNYKVENTRVGHMTNYDRLILQVWTNGAVSAKEAVSFAGFELIDHFEIFASLSERTKLSVPVKKIADSMSVDVNASIDEFNFSVRACNCLKRAGVNILKDLMVMNADEISKIKNLGKKSFEEIVERLTKFGWKQKCSNEKKEEEESEIEEDCEKRDTEG